MWSSSFVLTGMNRYRNKNPPHTSGTAPTAMGDTFNSLPALGVGIHVNCKHSKLSCEHSWNCFTIHSVILVAINFAEFFWSWIFWVLTRFPPTTHSTHIIGWLCPIKALKTRQTGWLRFFLLLLPSFRSSLWPPRTTAWLALVLWRQQTGMKFLCSFKSRKSGFMCTRRNASEQDCRVLQLDYVVCFACDDLLVV